MNLDRFRTNGMGGGPGVATDSYATPGTSFSASAGVGGVGAAMQGQVTGVLIIALLVVLVWLGRSLR